MTESLFRQYLTTVGVENELASFFLEVHEQHPLSRALRESRSPLMEGPLADKIKATTRAVVDRYHDVQYNLLASATTKALGMFTDNPKATGALKQVLRVGKLAATNRPLLSILIGIVGTLIGLASNPAAATQAGHQVEYLMQGDINHVIQMLEKSGIHVDVSPHGLEGLPAEIAPGMKKILAAMKAIKQYEFKGGANITSSRELFNNITVEANVQKVQNGVIEDMILKTADGKIELAHITTSVINGEVIMDERHGLKFELDEYWEDIPEQYRDAADAWIQNGIGGKGATGLELLGQVMAENWGKIAMLVAAAAAAVKGRAMIKMGPGGTKVAKPRVDPTFD